MMSRKTALSLLGLATLLLVAGCLWHGHRAAQEEPYTEQLFAMDTVIQLTAYGPGSEDAVQAAAQEIHRLDALLSIGNPNSEVSQLNATGTRKLSEDTAAMLRAAMQVYDMTGGLFDFTIYPLMELWGFPSDEPAVPAQQAIDSRLALVDGSKVQLQEDNTAILSSGQKTDFGGIAKGYASARVMEIFREHGIQSGLVSLGGNVQALSVRPDGASWRIGIQDPDGLQGAYLAVLSIADEAVVTSGGYERFFVENGQTYIHILDPRTGWPAVSDLLSATVVSKDGALADGLSTALYLMGRADATAFWQKHQDLFDMVLVTRDRTVCVTEGLAGRFQTDEKTDIIKK